MTTKPHPIPEPRTITLKDRRYQPSKAELDEDVRIDTSPADLIRLAFQQVKVVEDKDA